MGSHFPRFAVGVLAGVLLGGAVSAGIVIALMVVSNYASAYSASALHAPIPWPPDPHGSPARTLEFALLFIGLAWLSAFIGGYVAWGPRWTVAGAFGAIWAALTWGVSVSMGQGWILGGGWVTGVLTTSIALLAVWIGADSGVRWGVMAHVHDSEESTRTTFLSVPWYHWAWIWPAGGVLVVSAAVSAYVYLVGCFYFGEFVFHPSRWLSIPWAVYFLLMLGIPWAAISLYAWCIRKTRGAFDWREEVSLSSKAWWAVCCLLLVPAASATLALAALFAMWELR